MKTNRRDAVKLARLYRAGELTEIWPPDEAHEAMRDLVRAREAAVKDRTRKRQEIRSFLLRHGKIYPGKKAWGTKYFKWLHELSFGWPAQKIVLHEMIVAETQSRERVARLDEAIEDALLDWQLAPVVERLQALRGVRLIAAVTFMVEVGDIRRFEHPRQLIEVWLNDKHPVHEHLIEVVTADEEDESLEDLLRRLQKAAFTLRMLLVAWARNEDKAPAGMKDSLEDVRMDWGREARKFLNVIES